MKCETLKKRKGEINEKKMVIEEFILDQIFVEVVRQEKQKIKYLQRIREKRRP